MNILSSPLSTVNPCNTIEFDGTTPRLNRYNYEQNYLTEPSCSERNQRCAREQVPFILLLCDKPDCCIFHRRFSFKLKAYENSCFKSSSSTSLFIAVNICIFPDRGIECCLGHFIGRFVGIFFFWLLLFLQSTRQMWLQFPKSHCPNLLKLLHKQNLNMP